MTCLQYAALLCANWKSAVCQGLVIHDDGSLARDPELCGKPCKLRQRHRCSYFEQILMPQAKGKKDDTSLAAVVKDYMRIVREKNET